tara:strand:- start:111 stop:230 length:120 start_codon:yes stop_codon:yes gene_type:complete
MNDTAAIAPVAGGFAIYSDTEVEWSSEKPIFDSNGNIQI